MDTGTEKNNPGWLSPNVLTDFIDDLRDAGYKIGISQYIAAQDLILALTAQGETLNRPERLKTLLGPIFCSSPAEQEDFQERFDRWVELVSHTPRATERADVKAQALSKELGKIRRRFPQLILTLVAIILAGIFLPILWEESINDDSSRSTQPNAAQPDTTQPDTTQPNTTQPNTTQPNTTQPNTTQPNTTQPNQDLTLNWQISLFCFLLALCIAFLVWRLWWLWRANLFLQRHATTEQPELHKISIRDFEQNLFPTIMFIHAAQSLRQRIRIPSNELDVDTTIDATISQGGWLTPVYSSIQVLPEYLFLINRASYQDHQAKFIEEMVSCLQHNGVFITSYFFDDDPRICLSSDGTNSPRKLHEITAKYTQHRLVIVSDTEKLFSTQTGELEPWVSQLTTRGSRAILTPKPVENWGDQELVLARQFIVLPATPEGVRVLSQVLHQGTATYVLSEKDQISLPEPLRVRPHYWIERNPPKSEQINAMLKSLQEYLGKDGFYWLSACAVFPELHWNITIYLGNVLKTAEGHCLLEVCSLTNLARLPWLRYGYMPDWLRSLLIATLTDKQKHTIRTALQDLLITAVQGTVGRLQLEVAQKHHSFLPKLANSILSLLSRRATEGSPLRDYLFLSFITGQPKLAIEVSDTFSRILHLPISEQIKTYLIYRWETFFTNLNKNLRLGRYQLTALKLSVVLTLGLAGGIIWWSTKGSGIHLGFFSNNQSQPADLSNGSTFASVPNVPSGLFGYGGSTTWAPIRKVTGSVIQTAQPQFRLLYTDPTTGSPGSGSGIKMLLNNQLAFSQSSRSLDKSEYQQAQQQGFTLKEIPVAIDGIAIAVNPNLNIPGLTFSQLQDIYTGKITNWQQVGGPNLPIIPYSHRQEESGTVDFFVQNVLEKEKFGSNVQFISTTTQALSAVAKNIGGLYYASSSEVVGQCIVKPLPLGRKPDQLVPPYQIPFISLEQCPRQINQLNATAFQNGEYPLTRRLFVIVKQDGQIDQVAGEAYANLLLTSEGQKLISKAGFITIR